MKMSIIVFCIMVCAILFIASAQTEKPATGSAQADQAQAVAREAEGAHVSDEQQLASAETVLPVNAAKASPMMREIISMVQQQRQTVIRLKKQMGDAEDEVTALAIQRQIESATLNMQRQSLQIQLDYAEREGRSADAARLAKAIEVIDRPAPPVPPAQKRPPQANPTTDER